MCRERATPSASLGGLPAELKIAILQRLPDLCSLASATAAVPSLYQTVLAHDACISTQLLRKELPKHLWTHATVAHLVRQRVASFGDLDGLQTDAHIHRLVQGVRRLRDEADRYRASRADALAMLSTYQKVTALRDLFVNDCAYAKGAKGPRGQKLAPLCESLRSVPPAPTELARIERALYMYEIVACLCRHMVFTQPGNGEYSSTCFEKVSALQRALTERLMAPWEMYQVMHIQAYFRRVLHGFDRDKYASERIVPSLLVRGIDLVHELLCVAEGHNAGDLLGPLEETLLREPQHAFGVIVSRGLHQTWTRMEAQAFDCYRPFCPDGDRPGYESWRNLENQYQRFTLNNDPNILDLFHNWVTTKEGRVDLWAASLWDDSRWEDIEQAIHPPRATCWKGITHHWNSMAVGFQILTDPGLTGAGEEGCPVV